MKQVITLEADLMVQVTHCDTVGCLCQLAVTDISYSGLSPNGLIFLLHEYDYSQT